MRQIRNQIKDYTAGNLTLEDRAYFTIGVIFMTFKYSVYALMFWLDGLSTRMGLRMKKFWPDFLDFMESIFAYIFFVGFKIVDFLIEPSIRYTWRLQ